MNKNIIVIGTVLLAGLPGLCNTLQVDELRCDLKRLETARAESKVALRIARDAYNSIDTAYDQQKHAYELLVKAERNKLIAESKSIRNIGMNPYYSDMGHASGSIRLLNQQLGGS